MSNNKEDPQAEVEIQNLLETINSDMEELKKELWSLSSLIKKDESLSTTVKLANKKLMLLAKELEIDLEDLENSEDENEDVEQMVNGSLINATGVTQASDDLAKSMERMKS